MPKNRPKTFSKVTAVKAIARASVGTPAPGRILPDPKQKAAKRSRYKETLAHLLSPRDHEGDLR